MDQGEVAASRRSVHNQRIERLWRDVFSGCVCLFYHLFYALEDAQLLDPTNDADLFSLHYIFIPRLQQQLDIFRESYSHHRIRGQHNRSPYQLWVEGMARLNTDESAIHGAITDSTDGFPVSFIVCFCILISKHYFLVNILLLYIGVWH